MQVKARCLPFLLLLVGGCARKLPGPAECRAFALESVGVEAGTPASVLAYHPELEARAEEVTRKCLTTPWDYQLLDCLNNGNGTRLCLIGFQARRAR
jgi:hypothetical protein